MSKRHASQVLLLLPAAHLPMHALHTSLRTRCIVSSTDADAMPISLCTRETLSSVACVAFRTEIA
eukprot:2931630-Rhodomonas_salina.4